jgi:hypothetical protein
MDIREISTPALAYLGDCVLELCVRHHLIESGLSTSAHLNAAALDYVRAYDGRTTDLIAGISVFIPDCTDKLIWIWSEYIEPPPEHTNGEYRLDYVTRPLDGPVDPESPEFIMLRTPLIDSETGRKMSPPEIPQPIEFTDEEIRRLLNDNNQEDNQ